LQDVQSSRVRIGWARETDERKSVSAAKAAAQHQVGRNPHLGANAEHRNRVARATT
jgi:hypothetical protein